jgi:hypothetical protein
MDTARTDRQRSRYSVACSSFQRGRDARPTWATPTNMLDKPSEEDKIRDAMTEARDHPGRIVTR